VTDPAAASNITYWTFWLSEFYVLPFQCRRSLGFRSTLHDVIVRSSAGFAPTRKPDAAALYVGLALGERLRLPWFRTVFSNIGDVISPEILPPLELESRPVDVGELLTDQLSHFWWGSLLRNLADRVAPETQPALQLTSKPVLDIIPKSWILLPLWSEVVDTPKVFYPDKPKPVDAARPINLQPVAPAPEKRDIVPELTAADLLRDIRRSRIRQRIWVGLATAQIAYMVLAALGKL
jgi:hypothetical protein